jgi:hypothetical protein
MFLFLLGGFLGILGFLTGFYLKAWLDKTESKIILRREKGEELYAVSEAWFLFLYQHHVAMKELLMGKSTFKRYQATTAGIVPEADFSRIKMLVDMYFPQLQAIYSQLIEARLDMNKVMARLEEDAHDHAESNPADLKAFMEQQAVFEDISGEFQARVAALARPV